MAARVAYHHRVLPVSSTLVAVDGVIHCDCAGTRLSASHHVGI
jgi:hypothetical protein